MEEAIQRIMKESASAKHAHIATAANKALELLESATRSPPWTCRAAALECTRLAMESGTSRLTSLSLAALQRMARDDRFHSKVLEDDRKLWMSQQVLDAVNNTHAFDEQQKQDLLKVLLSLSCQPGWVLSGVLLEQSLSLYLALYADGAAAAKAAAQASCSQAVTQFCSEMERHSCDEASCQDALVVFQFVTSRVDAVFKPSSPKTADELPLLLQCLLSLLSHVPSALAHNEHFSRLVWTKLSPTLAALFDAVEHESSASSVAGVGTRLLLSAKWKRQPEQTGPPRLTENSVATLNACAVQMCRLLAPNAALRPVVESIVHKMLVSSSPKRRVVSLQHFKTILSDAKAIVALCSTRDAQHDEMTVFRLILDGLDDSCRRECSDGKLTSEALSCLLTLMTTLESVSRGSEVDAVMAKDIVAKYKSLAEADYEGPPTYGYGRPVADQSFDSVHNKDEEGEEVDATEGKGDAEQEPEQVEEERRMDGCGEDEVNESKAVGSLAGNDEEAEDEERKEMGSPTENAEKVEDDRKEVESPTENAENAKDDERKEEDSPTENPKERIDESDKKEKMPTESEKSSQVQENGFLQKESNDMEERMEAEGEERNATDSKPKEGSDAVSSDSEDTEGPEEGYEEDQTNNLSAYCEEAAAQELETAMAHSQRIPRTLLAHVDDGGDLDAGDDDASLDEGDHARDELERANARVFVERLREHVEQLARARGAVEIDFLLQKFASTFCHDFSTHSPQKNFEASSSERTQLVILNADGVYLACYYTLHLNLRLAMTEFYSCSSSSSACPPVSKHDFIGSVLGSGLLVFVSPTWLSEVYDVVSEVDVFGFCAMMSRLGGLRGALSDLDGLGRTDVGAQMIGHERRVEAGKGWQNKAEETDERLPEWAGLRLCRRLITACWSSILSMLLTSLGPHLSSDSDRAGDVLGLVGLLNAPRPQTGVGGLGARAASAAASAASAASVWPKHVGVGIECLQSTAALCSRLELHERVGETLQPLVALVCARQTAAVNKSASGAASCHVVALAAVDWVLLNGCEMGSQAPDCWKHVMRCVEYAAQLGERSTGLVLKGLSAKSSSRSRLTSPNESPEDELPLSTTFGAPAGFCSDESVSSLAQIFAHYLERKDMKTHLTPEEWATVKDIFAKRVDKLFEDAALRLNLKALTGFMSELSFCSHRELLQLHPQKASSTKIKKQKAQTASDAASKMAVMDSKAAGVLLFQRISDVMLNCIKGGRPLLHSVKAWAVVGPHLMEAACHKDNSISRRAVDYIHDIINAFFQHSSELPYFHFNEALFKPFENLVTLELCDLDVQDQIVTCICEFVESNTTDICSGWKSLFGTLKSVRFPMGDTLAMTARESHWRAVLDVFEAFLATEDTQVFANAALDFVQCLNHHVRGDEEMQQLEELISLKDVEKYATGGSVDLTRASLSYLMQCHDILRRMRNMSCCPAFHGAHKINVLPAPAVVDPNVPDWGVKSWDAATDTVPDFPYSFRCLQTSDAVGDVSVLTRDAARGLYRVWYLLLDGLTSAVINCPRSYQSQAVDTLFDIFGTLQVDFDSDGADLAPFGLYCTNHLLLPMLQSWLRRTQRTFQGWEAAGPNFKHCMGKATELVLRWLQIESPAEARPHLDLLLKQHLLLLTECIVVPVESVARLGCSCLRHLILSGGPQFDSVQWTLSCLSLCRALQITLFPLHQIMAPFYQGSANFYGDLGQVKVAARRDSCRRECHRLLQLAQQVFLLDEQKSELPMFPENPDAEERSFLLLLQSPHYAGGAAHSSALEDAALVRVAMRSLLTGLTANHILLQMIGTILLRGTKHVVPSLANLLLHGSITSPMTPTIDASSVFGRASTSSSSSTAHSALPGMLDKLQADHIQMLLCALRGAFHTALEFDSRPGLKFLVQKVAQLNEAANLYKQAGASWSLVALALFDLCMFTLGQTTTAAVQEDIRRGLEQQQRNKNTKVFTAVQDTVVTKDGAEADPKAVSAAYFVDLHNLFLDLSELYADIVVDKSGTQSKLDAMSRQQLYFLTVEPDDFNELLRQPKQTPNANAPTEAGAKSPVAAPPRGTPTKEKPEKEERRPFQFADFARANSSKLYSPNDDEDGNLAGSSDSKSKGSGRGRLDSDMSAGASNADQDSDGDEVFRVATQSDFDNMLSEFRHNKGKRSLPSTSNAGSSGAVKSSSSRQNPFAARSAAAKDAASAGAAANCDPEIAAQQQASLMADSVAQKTVFTELVLVLLQLSADLDDERFRVMLPVLFPGVKALTAFAEEAKLKLQIAAFFQRVASIFGFDPDV